MDGCPKKIKIPDIFSAMNKQIGNGQTEEAKKAYAAAIDGAGKASDCIECRQCERACPQHLPITDNLKEAVKMFG